MTKKELRQYFKQQRNNLSEAECFKMDDLLLIQFQQWELPSSLNVLLSYWPLKQHKELNTHLLTDYLQFRLPGLHIAYPVSDFTNHSMQAVLADEDTRYIVNDFGIAEPVEGERIDPVLIDAVFVPLLAFDKKGYRVGYGKGFYDRYLSTCREDIIKIGFSYFDPVEAIHDINQFDVPLSAGITPNAIYEF